MSDVHLTKIVFSTYNVETPLCGQGSYNARPKLSEDAPATGLSERHSYNFAQNLHFASRYLGNICTFNGMPVQSKSSRDWIRACTGEDFRLTQLSEGVGGWKESIMLDASDAGVLDLPNLASLEEEINSYRLSAVGMFFPIIEPSLFKDTITAAYDQMISSVSPGWNSARACIYSFHALALTVAGDTTNLSAQSSVRYAREAYRLLPQLLGETATLDGLQALLLLVSQASLLNLIDLCCMLLTRIDI